MTAGVKKYNVGILLFPEVDVLDFTGPFEVFSRTRLEPGPKSRRSDQAAPFNVFTVAKKREPLLATGGLEVVPAYAWADAPAISILVVPGGFGTRPLLAEPEVLAWIARTSKKAQLTVSVCTGSLLLAAAGVLKKKTATTHWGALDILESLNRSADAQVTIDSKQRVIDTGVGIITCAGVASGIDMAFYVVEKLFGKEVTDETAHYIEYRRAAV